MLSATPTNPVIGVAAPFDPTRLAQIQAAAVNSVSLMPVAPFPLEQTFLLHSDPTATKTIYLDFDGFTTRNTPWNTLTGLPNIVTQPYDSDGNVTTNFSDTEKLEIQDVWERASEDFRPFDVDVTTEDPGTQALMNTGLPDDQWGIRVVIGGSTLDWFTPTTGTPAGGVAYIGSFSWDTDVPCFVFGGDYFGDSKAITEAVSHETGHTVGLEHDGQYRFYYDTASNSFKTVTLPYYGGHPDPATGPTSWAPIMGVGYYEPLTQWSKGEYFNANNIEDDLAIITDLSTNGFGYRIDDHGSTLLTADPLVDDPVGTSSSVGTFTGEGIIEQNTDVDYFSFTVEGLGEVVSLDITPFHAGPNLDVLAKLYGPSGSLIATSNPVDDLLAGSQSYDPAITDSGWLDANGQQLSEFILAPGTYYISVEGTGRPVTYVDPSVHPGPIVDPPKDPAGNPILPPDGSDWGYSNYGSLGYYSITGTRTKELVVGIDFDDGGLSPTNWNLYTGGGPDDLLKDLISEAGTAVPYQLEISTTGQSIDAFASANPIDPLDIPVHTPALDGLDGFIAAEDQTWTFTWSNLAPSTVYQIYVFGHDDVDAGNIVTVTGGQWNGVQQVYNFTQDVAADSLVVNDNVPGNQDLSTLSLLVISNVDGEITINVTNQAGFEAALGGLAIAPTKVGSISGQKWNDADGSQTKDPNENGLPGWTIYLDLNNNGQLDLTSSPDQVITQASLDIPQALQDYTAVKSNLDFAGVGQIQDVNVAIDITHTYDADMHVYLISPLGTRVKLFANVGLSGDNFHNTILDDAALIPIATAAAPFTGTFRPEEPLSAFDNEDAFGTWQLELTDDSAGDTGVLNSWSLTITLKGVTTFLEPFQVTDANGDYTFTDLKPGLYHVREYVQPQQLLAGWQPTWAPTPVTVRSGAQVQDIDFGNWIPLAQRGSIQGQKFYDANQDGVKDEQEPGLPGWVIYVDSNDNHVRDIASTPTVIAATGLPKPITDFQTTTSQVTVNSLGTVFNIEVTLDITHSFVDDLDAYLVSPSGRQVELFTGVGGQYNNFTDLTLADNGARSIATIGFNDLPYTGRWKPEGLLSDFVGDDAAGIWTLVVSDTAFADQGTLNSWSLSITTGELFRTTDSDGNYEFDNLVAGPYAVREEPQAGWVQVPPTTTDIPGATWNNPRWDVTVVGIDDFNDPDGPDSHRNVKNVDFGNYGAVGSLQGYVYKDSNGNSAKAPGERGLPGWTVFIDSDGSGTLDTGTVDDTAFSDTAQAINNFFVVSSKVWFGSISSISDVDVSLDISHTYDGDLTAYLISPSGTRVKLFSNVGGSGDDFFDTTFDDSASQSITTGIAPFDDIFKPAELLSAFNGENSNGFWTLEITDSSAADDGSLNGWSLTILGDELSTVTDALGNYSFANLPPGTYHIDTVQNSGWTRTEVPGPVTLAPSQNVLNVNFGNQQPFLAGDYNDDGIVDSSDYVVWRRQLGSNVSNFTGADGDGDGDVDHDDFIIWRENFGHYRDDHGNNAASATLVTVPSSLVAQIEVPGDVDWFKFNVTGGTTYQVNANFDESITLFDTDGTTPLATNSGIYGYIQWTPTVSGTYFIAASSTISGFTGPHFIRFATDDFGNDAAHATLIASPSTTTGSLEIYPDKDWFKFNATAGTQYPVSIFSPNGGIIQVLDTDGATILTTGYYYAPPVFTAPANGTYYIVISADASGDIYHLTLGDDHGNTSATATPIGVPSSTPGVIETDGDVDMFSFVANSGTSYHFEEILDNLGSSVLYLIDTDGSTVIDFDPSGFSTDPAIDWTATSSGTYFLKVSVGGVGRGLYTLDASITAPIIGGGMSLSSNSGLNTLSFKEPSQLAAAPSSDVLAASSSPAFLPPSVTSFARHAISSSFSRSTPISADESDLALLDWLASAGPSISSTAAGSSFDGDYSASLSDEPDSVDVAFDTLEGSALAATAI